MSRWWAALVVGLVACGGGPLQQGADAFERGDLEAAIAPWEAVAEDGNASGRVHFDLGNAWYRKGDLARAVAHYRVAQALRPRDGNVHHNLAVVRSELRGVPEPVPPVAGWMRFATPAELGALAVVLSAAGSALALRWRRKPGHGFGLPAVICGVLGLVLAVLSASGAIGSRSHPVAVPLSEVPARDLPVPDGEIRFSLPSGAELRVVEEAGDFVLVEDGRDRRGWVSRASLFVGS